MRLLSKLKDYYDGAMRSDREPTPVYVRDLSIRFVPHKDHAGKKALDPIAALFEDVPVPQRRKPRPEEAKVPITRHPYERFVTPVCVLFAGVSYWGYVWDPMGRFPRGELWQDPTARALHFRTLDQYCNGFQPLVEQIQATRGEDVISGHLNRNLELQLFHRTKTWLLEDLQYETGQTFLCRNPLDEKAWEKFLLARKSRETRQGLVDLHRREGAPVLLFYEDSSLKNDGERGLFVVKNPSLKAIGFQRLVPVSQAWQQIDMFLGNDMATQNDPLPLDDKYRRDAHGFDEWSFKQKSPGEKKARRAKGKSV